MTTSDESLRDTFKREKPVHSRWPATFEEAIKEPGIRAALVALYHRQVSAFARRQSINAPSRPRSIAAIVRTRLDGKSLAAGEKPEPDDD